MVTAVGGDHYTVSLRPDADGRGPGRIGYTPLQRAFGGDDVGSFELSEDARIVVADARHEPDVASRLAAIVESSDDAMIGKTLEGVVTSWNSGAERMYGYTSEEIVGRNISALVPPDRLDEVPAILELVGNGERVDHFETKRRRKDGSIFDVSVTISPIRDRNNGIAGASTVTRDISARKRAEVELRVLQDTLYQAQRLESLGQLAGGIAHDFNNLLAGIMNYAALVADGLDQLTKRLGLGDDEGAVALAEDIAQITVVATRAAQLTRQLLIFGRREVSTPEILDLNDVVIDMTKLLGRTLGETIELVTELAPDLPRTEVDRGQIEQVLMNLIVNARDAMSGGGRVRIETGDCGAEHDWVHQHGEGWRPCVCLAVTDTGSGMTREIKARAFEPFFTTKVRGGGSGLGLATVYGIVTQAGGAVAIQSEPGLGTTVRVQLPATNDSVSATREPIVGAPARSPNETILLVEDEDIVREPAARMLVRYGYTVLSASNSEQALRIANDYPGTISLMLSDVVMPDRSGKDLATELRQIRPETKVLYMSGYSPDVIIHTGISEDGANLIEKPFVAGNLLRRIRQMLDTT
jgi:PAS domain S-box-containing protein